MVGKKTNLISAIAIVIVPALEATASTFVATTTVATVFTRLSYGYADGPSID